MDTGIDNNQVINPDVFYRPPEAAKRIGMTTRWLQYDRSTKQEIPFTKLGNQVLYKGADMLAVLDASRIGGGARNA